MSGTPLGLRVATVLRPRDSWLAGAVSPVPCAAMTKLPQMDPVAPPPPPPPLGATPPPPPPPAAKPSKVRTYITIAVLVVVLAGVLYAVRNKTDADSLTVG